MHQCINAPIEEAVLGFEAHNPEWARFIMLSTASIGFRITTHFRIFGSCITFATPLGAGHS